MKEIQLTQNKVAWVDNEDFERVSQHKWYARLNISNGRWYAQRSLCLANGKWSPQYMHRFILGLEHGDPHKADHRDRVNTLDNRRENLRVTLDQNQQNSGLRKHNTSGFKGVYPHRRKWKALIGADGG